MIDIAAELAKIAAHPRGVIGNMQDMEAAKGFSVIPWGATFPITFGKFSWHDGVLSIDEAKKEIRIVAIYAQEQGRGIFKQLVSDIRSAGYRPVVVEPIGLTMPSIMRRWEWDCSLAEYEDEVMEEWRPKS